jgi:hypothetical protein
MIRILSFALLLGITGCSPSVDQKSSVQVMGAALQGTSQAQAKLMGSVTGNSAQFDGDVTNPAGTGSAHVSGSAQSGASGWNSTFDISYTHWVDAASNITLDGSLHESASFTTLDPLVGSAHLSGTLHATGAVQAEVDFDLTVTYSTTGVDMSGSIGGNAIHASAH